jgi:hypothetical protein
MELVERVPEVFTYMSLKAENCLARSVLNDAYAAKSEDPWVRELYERMAQQWFDLAVEHEDKASSFK